VGELI